jgi:hypothetical protein
MEEMERLQLQGTAQMAVIHLLQVSLPQLEVVVEARMQLVLQEVREVAATARRVMQVVQALLVKEMQEDQVQVVQTVIQVAEVVQEVLALLEDLLLLLIHLEELGVQVLLILFQGHQHTMQVVVVAQSPLILSVEHLETVWGVSEAAETLGRREEQTDLQVRRTLEVGVEVVQTFHKVLVEKVALV